MKCSHPQNLWIYGIYFPRPYGGPRCHHSLAALFKQDHAKKFPANQECPKPCWTNQAILTAQLMWSIRATCFPPATSSRSQCPISKCLASLVTLRAAVWYAHILEENLKPKTSHQNWIFSPTLLHNAECSWRGAKNRPCAWISGLEHQAVSSSTSITTPVILLS